MEIVLKILNIVVLAGIVVVGFMTLQRVDIYLKIKAIDDCGRVAQYEKTLTKDDAKVTYPLLDVYNSCLKEKGYK